MKKTVLVIVILSLLGVGYYFYNKNKTEIKVEPVKYKDLIEVDLPLSGDKISSPLQAFGKARGNWYFEASFPVQVVDEDGTLLGSGPAQAQGEWMTEGYVPFSAKINFYAPKGDTGKVIFKKDNPSGDPARDDSVSIPVVFR